jgi:hypothetical protein
MFPFLISPGVVAGGGGAVAPAGPTFDLDYTTGTYITPNAKQPFLEQIGYTTAMFEAADGSLTTIATPNLRRTSRGLYICQDLNPTVLQTRDLTQAVWVKSGITAALNQAGRNSAANGCSSITATADGGTVLQTTVATSAARGAYADVKRISGSGTIEMTRDGGASWTVLDLSHPRFNGWSRVSLGIATAANDVIGFRLSTTGDIFAIDHVQIDEAPYETCIVPQTTAKVMYYQNRYSAYESFGAGWQAALRGSYTLFAEWAQRRTSGGLFIDTNGTFINGGTTLSYRPQPNGTKVVTTANSIVLATSFQMAELNRIVARFDASTGAYSLVLNDGAIVSGTGASGLPVNSDHMDLGDNGSGVSRIDGLVRRLVIRPDIQSDAWAMASAAMGYAG